MFDDKQDLLNVKSKITEEKQQKEKKKKARQYREKAKAKKEEKQRIEITSSYVQPLFSYADKLLKKYLDDDSGLSKDEIETLSGLWATYLNEVVPDILSEHGALLAATTFTVVVASERVVKYTAKKDKIHVSDKKK